MEWVRRHNEPSSRTDARFRSNVRRATQGYGFFLKLRKGD